MLVTHLRTAELRHKFPFDPDRKAAALDCLIYLTAQTSDEDGRSRKEVGGGGVMGGEGSDYRIISKEEEINSDDNNSNS